MVLFGKGGLFGSKEAGDSDSDEVVIGADDASDWNPEQILPQSPDDIAKIRTWLQPTSYDIAGGEYRKHLSSHLHGTGAWLTSSSTYQDWIKGEDHGLLWIRGIPGSGKSVMAAKLIDEIKTSYPKCPVLFFFFRQIIAANHDSQALLRDWMDQLLSFSPPLQQRLKSYVKDGRTLDSLSTEDLWKDLRMAFAGLPDRVFCVADALDEIDKGNETFLQALGALGQWRSSKVKVLITSRPVPTVEGPLRKTPALHIRLEEKVVDMDIATFVQHSLAHSQIPQDRWQVIADAVPGRANGLFLYAKLAMDAFLEPGADVDTVLSELPADLNVLYTDLLEEHAKRSRIAPEVQHLILQAVTHANRPLRLLELVEMIRVTSPDGTQRDTKSTKDLIRAACGPLLEILPDETISVIHHSFTEYLRGNTRSKDDPGYPILEPGPTHADLAIACLRYLTSGCLDSIKVNIDDTKTKLDYEFCESYTWWAKDKVGDDEVRVRLKHPFFEYAAENWASHIRRSEVEKYDQTRVIVELRKLLGDRKNLRAWLQMKWTGGPKGAVLVTALHVAAYTGLVSYTEQLVGELEVDCLDVRQRTPLWWAANKGHADAVRVLIGAGANPDYDEPVNGHKPLHQAASHDHAEVARVLLEAGVDPLTPKTHDDPGRRCGNARSTKGDTPLRYIAHNGHVGVLNVLLPYIKDLSVVNTALRWACKSGNAKVVARMLQYPGINPNNTRHGGSLLQLACKAHDLETVKVLMEAGAHVNLGRKERPSVYPAMWHSDHDGYQDETGTLTGPRTTCLHELCGVNGRQSFGVPEQMQEILTLLLEAGADIHLRTSDGSTVLHGSVPTAHASILRMLLDAGADANVVNNQGLSPLHCAQSPEVVALLVELGGADINIVAQGGLENRFDRKRYGQTPLLRMIADARPQAILKLLEYKPDCQITDDNGEGALHIVLNKDSDIAVVEALLQHGADPDIQNRDGLTPLLCLRDDHRQGGEVLDLLLQAGADINARDRSGRTRLMRIKNDATSAFQALVDRGAAIDIRDHTGRTALHEAVGDCVMRNYMGRRVASKFEGLAALGLDVKAVDHQGNNLLHELAKNRGNYSSYESSKLAASWAKLLEYGLDPDDKNYLGQTPLHLLCESDNDSNNFSSVGKTSVDYIISKSKDINAADNHGVTPLHIAATKPGMAAIKLLRAGADPLVTTHEDLTPLHLAARSGQSNHVGLLLQFLKKAATSNHAALPSVQLEEEPMQHQSSSSPGPTKKVPGVDARAWSDKKQTPLYFAIASGRPESVAMLLEAGADPDIINPLEACVEFQEYSGEVRRDATSLTLAVDEEPTQQYRADHIPERFTARLEEILQMLIAHRNEPDLFKGPNNVDWIDLAECKHKAYVADCLRDIREPPKPGAKSYTSFPKLLAESQSKVRREEYLRFLKRGSIRPDSGNEEMTRDLLIQRQFHLVQQLPSMGCQFFPTSKHSSSCNIDKLIKNGYASLLEKMGPALLEERLEKQGDYHAFGDATKPGLWFAKRDPTTSGSLNPALPLIEASKTSHSNMDVIRLLVERFGVDLNEQVIESYWGKDDDDDDDDDDGNTKRHYGPSHCALTELARGCRWWQIHQALPYLLSQGANVNIRNRQGQTPLQIVLSENGIFKRDAAKILIEAGADVNAVDNDGKSCLAYTQDATDMFQLMISHGAALTPDSMYNAVAWRNIDNVKILLNAGMDPDINPAERMSKDGTLIRQKLDQWGPDMHHDRWTPLLYAADLQMGPYKTSRDTEDDGSHMEKVFSIIRLLLDYGADPFATYYDFDLEKVTEADAEAHKPKTTPPDGQVEKTVLHSLLKDARRVDPILLLPTLDVNRRDAMGRTLLHATCEGENNLDHVLGSHMGGDAESGAPTIYERLLFYGAELDAEDNHGRNVLHYLASRDSGDDYSISRALPDILKRVPDLVNRYANGTETPLHTAVRHGGQLIRRFLDAGADPLLVTSKQDSLLHLLARNMRNEEDSQLFNELIRRGIDINNRNAAGETALFCFAQRPGRGDRWCYWQGDEAEDTYEDTVIAMFQELGAEFFATDNQGRGLLHVAAKGPVERFKQWMALGLDPMMEDDAHQTAIDVVAACANRPILELFEKKA